MIEFVINPFGNPQIIWEGRNLNILGVFFLKIQNLSPNIITRGLLGILKGSTRDRHEPVLEAH